MSLFFGRGDFKGDLISQYQRLIQLQPLIVLRGGAKRWKPCLLKEYHPCMSSKLFATPWTVAHQAPVSMEFSRQEYWSGLPFPSPGDLPDPERDQMCLGPFILAGRFFTTGGTWEGQPTHNWDIREWAAST